MAAFWVFLALFIATEVLGELLTPKPRGTRTAAPDPTIPTASVGTPIPVVFGTMLLAPNVAWFGDVKKVERNKYVSTGFLGLDSTKVFLGYDYYVGMQGVLCWGPLDQLTDIIVDGTRRLSAEPANTIITGFSGWTPTMRTAIPVVSPTLPAARAGADTTAFTIDAPNFFGGPEWEGGIGGDVNGGRTLRLHWGTDGQLSNTYLNNQTAILAGGGISRYHGLAFAVFEQVNLGKTPNPKPWAFEVARWPNNLGDAVKCQIGQDANPAEIIYEILTNNRWSIGMDGALINTASFQSARDTLYTEGLGLSVVLNAQSDADSIVQDALRHIDGVLFMHPTTGLLTLKLARADYDPSALITLDENSALSVDLTAPLWDELPTDIKITFTERIQLYQQGTATGQNLALATLLGTTREETVDFPMATTGTVAQMLAERTLRATTQPLKRAVVKVNRLASTLGPGDCFRLSWARYGISSLIMRVTRPRLGPTADGTIELDCVQDVFATQLAIYAPPPATGWTNPITTAYKAPSVQPVQSQTATLGTLRLQITDDQSHVTLVETQTKSGAAAVTAFATQSTAPYTTNVTLDPALPSYIGYRVTYTGSDGTSQTVTGEADFPVSQAPGAPLIALSIDGSGNVTATVPGADNRTANVKYAASTAGYPTAATVRAATADSPSPFSHSFTQSLTGLTAGGALYVAALSYDGSGNESPLGTAQIARAGGGTGSITTSGILGEVAFHASFGLDVVVSAVPAVTTEIADYKRRWQQLDGVAQWRAIIGVQGAASAGAVAFVRYSTNGGSTWSDGPGATIASASATAPNLGTWLAGPGTTGDVLLMPATRFGDGVTDAVITSFVIQTLPGTVTTPGGGTIPGAGSHRYARLKITANSGDATFVAIDEIQFRSTAGGADLTSPSLAATQAFSGGAGSDGVGNGVAHAFSDDGTQWARNTPPTTLAPVYVGWDFNGTTPTIVQFTILSDNVWQRAPQTWTFQTSDDGTTYTDVASFAAYCWLPGQLRTFPEAPADPSGFVHRAWRLRITSSFGTDLFVNEIEMRATAGGADQTVPSSLVGNSSGRTIENTHGIGFDSDFAFDNDTTAAHAWGPSGSSNTTGVLGYVFAAPTTVRQFAVWCPTDTRTPHGYVIEFSDDESTWTPAASGNFGTWTTGVAQLVTW